jgi:ubiquinone biosynthesis protein
VALIRRVAGGEQSALTTLYDATNRLVFGLIISSLFLGSAMMWAAGAPPKWHDISLFGAFGCAVSCFLGFHLFRAIQHSGRLEEGE